MGKGSSHTSRIKIAQIRKESMVLTYAYMDSRQVSPIKRERPDASESGASSALECLPRVAIVLQDLREVGMHT